MPADEGLANVENRWRTCAYIEGLEALAELREDGGIGDFVLDEVVEVDLTEVPAAGVIVPSERDSLTKKCIASHDELIERQNAYSPVFVA